MQWRPKDQRFENIIESNNNGLEFTALVLENIYTDRKYPNVTKTSNSTSL